MLRVLGRIRLGRPGVLVVVSGLGLTLGGCVNNPEYSQMPVAAPSTFASASSAPALGREHLERRGWVSDGDLDGDGRLDDIVIRPRRAEDEVDATNPARLIGSLASGERVSSGWWLTDPGVRLFGTYDVDGDGREELFVRSEGESHSVGLVVELVDGHLRLVKVQKPDGNSEPFRYVFAVHSDAQPLATFDVACAVVADVRELLVASSQLVGGPFTNVQEMKAAARRWSLATYELRQGRMTLVASDAGVVGSQQPVPSTVPSENMLRCGSSGSGAVSAS